MPFSSCRLTAAGCSQTCDQQNNDTSPNRQKVVLTSFDCHKAYIYTVQFCTAGNFLATASNMCAACRHLFSRGVCFEELDKPQDRLRLSNEIFWQVKIAERCNCSINKQLHFIFNSLHENAARHRTSRPWELVQMASVQNPAPTVLNEHHHDPCI